jgi:hypothetical protein
MKGIESWYRASFSNGYCPLTSGSSPRIFRIYSRLSEFSAIKSWTNRVLTYIADVVMETISPTRRRFFTK